MNIEVEDEKKNSSYTSGDIAKYHQGLLSPKEMHALEKAALDDPFLADALDGYRLPGGVATAAMDELQSRLQARVREAHYNAAPVPVNRFDFSWWKVAAMLIIVAGAAFLTYRFVLNNNTKEIAQNPATEKATAAQKDSISMNAPQEFRSDSDAKTIIASDTLTGTEPINPPGPARRNADQLARASGQRVQEQNENEEIEVAASPPASQQNRTTSPIQNNEETNRETVAANAAAERKADDDALAGRKYDSAAARENGYTNMTAKRKSAAPNPRNIFKGKITDASNNPLPFSNITNIEDNIGTYSDAKGNFILTSPDSILKVQVSALGFETGLIELHKGIPGHAITLSEDPSIPEIVIAKSKVNTKRIRLHGNTREEPEPQDGWDNYDTYLANNTQLPAFLKNKGDKTMGEVEISFEVDKDGKPKNIAVSKSLCASCDEEAIRLVKEGPRWKRKAKKGKATVNIAF